VISLISVVGITVASAAMVIVLSIFNGFGALVEDTFNAFDPDLKITPRTGKVFDYHTPEFEKALQVNGVLMISESLEENALFIFNDRQVPVLVKGVSEDFRLMTDMDKLLVSGSFRLREDVVDFVTLGTGLAQSLGARAGFVQPIEIYTPRRNVSANVALTNPLAAFTSASVQIGGTFLLSQPELDEQLGIIPIQLARELFDYETEVTSLNLKLTPDASVRRVRAEIQRIIGYNFRVETRFEQQREAYRMLQIEKWVTFLILSLILLIAVFNIVGSITMLIEEKKEDIKSLRNLGAPRQMILRVFLYHGWLISLLGAVSGIVLGTVVSLLQQHFGFLRLGGAPGAYIVEAYPIIVQFTDILMTFGIVSLISLFTVFYPVNSRIKN
jgi:ABC-type lipoprotein release transport system permease subunit